MAVKQRCTTNPREEWAGAYYNFEQGCTNCCRYCYARAMAIRQGRCTVAGWADPQPYKTWLQGASKYHGGALVMYPTTHDITPANIDSACIALRRLIHAGNPVLIVSKPRLECIRRLISTASQIIGGREAVSFRLTVTTVDAKISRLWEPGASLPQERLDCLRLVADAGYDISVSSEPWLGGLDEAIAIHAAVTAAAPISCHWIGRVALPDYRIGLEGTEEAKLCIEWIHSVQSQTVCRAVRQFFTKNPLIKFKQDFLDFTN